MSRTLGSALISCSLVCCSLLAALAADSLGQKPYPRPNEAEAKIEAALGETAKLDFADQPLADIIEQLAKQHKIPIQVDYKALTNEGFGSDTPVTAHIEGVSLRSALRLVLGQLDLTYVVCNEVLFVTTKTEAENMLTCKVYPVFDLVVRPSNAAPRGRAVDYQSLIEGLMSTISPTSWDDGGGPGAIQEFTNAGALVISQTTEVHEEIASYLRALRQVSAEQK